ncbi:MAG: Penicillin-binding protein 2D [Parcubacteria group bacterium ADurb.Bin247]|nr:MAG: Penicillin-binding protein 2D [Parcubacteria group bacterium ADurb.Bin247]
MKIKIYKERLVKKLKPLLKNIFNIAIVLILAGIILGLSLFLYYTKDFPRPDSLSERSFVEPTKIYDRTGKVVLYTIYGEEKRDIIPLDNIPKHLVHAVVSAEDDDFYKHFGIDFNGIARSILENLKGWNRSQGGSTISQQLIRNTFLTGDKTISRKVREIILTLELERRYSKDEIMEFYLNQIPFGGNAYGVESAAQTFFNKSASDLEVQESAIIASIIKSPSRLSPYGNYTEELMIRKDYVLDRMAYLGYLSEDEAQEYKEKEIIFSPSAQLLRAPHFTLEITQYLEKTYGEDYLKTRGLKVYTSIDWELQQKAEEIVKQKGQDNIRYNAHNLSLVALNPNNGEILAMVGSADYFKDPYPEGCTPGKNCRFEPYPNVAKRLRQPGSAFKPFVYTDAFKKGYTDKTIVVDEPINYAGYSPKNYDGMYRGAITLRSALAQSLNVPAVKVLAEMTSVEDSIKTASDFGITTLTKPASFYGLPLVLGGGEVTLLEMTSAYGVFASNGYANTPVSILKIVDSSGKIVEEKNSSPKKVLDSNIAKMINDILSDNDARSPMFGYNSTINIPGISVKTGTTQNYKDGWTIGYNNSIVIGVWAGNNDNTPMINAPGISVAAPAWRELFEYYLSKV